MSKEAPRPMPEATTIHPKFEDGIEALRGHKPHKAIAERGSRLFTHKKPTKIWIDEESTNNIFKNEYFEKDFKTDSIAYAITFTSEPSYNKDGGVEAFDGIAEFNGKKLPTRVISVYGRLFVLSPSSAAPKLQ